jgi:hypothetical protein
MTPLFRWNYYGVFFVLSVLHDTMPVRQCSFIHAFAISGEAPHSTLYNELGNHSSIESCGRSLRFIFFSVRLD